MAEQRLDLLGSPTFAVSILVLLINDHILKSAWPGLITGKLSDVAGVAMIAIALSAVIGRPVVALAATFVGFGLLKTVPAVAELAAPVLGGVTRTDPFDLLALAVLLPVWWWLHRRPAAPPTVGNARMGLGRQVVLITAAVFATTATSCDTKGVDAIYEYDGALLASASDGKFVSTDGGASWQGWPSDVAIDWDRVRRQTEVCLDTVCFRADERNSSLTQLDGTQSSPVLKLDQAAQDEISKLGNPDCLTQAFSTIAVVDVEGAQHAVVSMGPAGAIFRTGDGSWAWVKIGRWSVPDSDGDGVAFGLPISISP